MVVNAHFKSTTTILFVFRIMNKNTRKISFEKQEKYKKATGVVKITSCIHNITSIQHGAPAS